RDQQATLPAGATRRPRGRRPRKADRGVPEAPSGSARSRRARGAAAEPSLCYDEGIPKCYHPPLYVAPAADRWLRVRDGWGKAAGALAGARVAAAARHARLGCRGNRLRARGYARRARPPGAAAEPAGNAAAALPALPRADAVRG